MAKKKKDLDFNIDTPNVDVKVVRKNGRTKIDIDSTNVSVDIEKDAENTNVEVITHTKAGATILKILRAIRVLK